MVSFLFVVTAFAYVSAVIVNISNVHPRHDSTGVIMDVHDGNTFYMDGQYWYFGASYGLCREPSGPSGCSDFAFGNCGFRLDHNVSLFTSTDFAACQPTLVPVFQMSKEWSGLEGILFCPKVIYHRLSKTFVLWFNWLPKTGGSFAQSLYAVATSYTPYGPFVVVNSNVTTLAYTNTGDFNLMVDDDDNAYIIYTAHIQGPWPVTHRMSIERLSADYRSTMGASHNTGFFGESFVEAPALFKRQGVYYAVFGQCCCYCASGSPVTFYTASSPLGPYQNGTSLGPNIPAQQTHIVAYRSMTKSASSSSWQYLWQGDRWQSAPDGLKGHDFSYWGPLTFDSEGEIQPLDFQDAFTIDVAPSIEY